MIRFLDSVLYNPYFIPPNLLTSLRLWKGGKTNDKQLPEPDLTEFFGFHFKNIQ